MTLKHLVMSATAAILMMGTMPTDASAASLSGSWRGGGVMTLSSGAQERVSCKVKYFRQSSTTFSMSAKCASGAGALNQSGSLMKVGSNAYQGTVFNAEHGVTASVYVTLSGRRQKVSISTAGGSARLSLRK